MASCDPEKKQAYQKVRRALERGDLVRPDLCDECRQPPRRGRDGRSLIQGHHYLGYKQPLSVRWLCVLCHSRKTPQPIGLRNGNAKLTDDQVIEIRNGRLDASKTGRLYGVSATHVLDIRNRKRRNRALKEPAESSAA